MIQVIDLGISSLRSLTSALSQLGKDFKLVNKGEKLSLDGSPVLIPGNGNFGKASDILRQQDLVNSVRDAHEIWGSKVIGICLGMQLLFVESEESYGGLGFGFFNKKIVKLSTDPKTVLPVLGWREVTFRDRYAKYNGWYYFAHSYGLPRTNDEFCEGTYLLHGNPIVASVYRKNLVGFQFHPEKSGPLGMQLLAMELDD